MKILIIDKHGNNKIKDTDILPRIGDNIDMLYFPRPFVKSVLLWPSDDTLRGISKNIDAIVTVE